MIIFLVGSYTVFSSYFVANFYMLKHSTSYAAIPDDKKFYVLSNILKSAVLFAYCPIAAKTLKGALLDGVWSTARIHNLGILYAIPGASAAPHHPSSLSQRTALAMHALAPRLG